jgi:hypothetical protein
MGITLIHSRFSQLRFDLLHLKKNRKLMVVRVKVVDARPPLFDPNNEPPSLPTSALVEEFGPANLAPFLAPVADTLPSLL